MARTKKTFRLWNRGGVFYCRYPQGSGWRSTGIETKDGRQNKEKAEQWALEHRDLARPRANTEASMANRSLRDFLEPYFSERCPHCLNRKRMGRPVTEGYRRRMRSTLDLHVLTDRIADMKMRDITRGAYSAFQDRLSAKLSARTINFVSQALRISVKRGLFLEQIPQDFTAGFGSWKENRCKTGTFTQAEVVKMFKESPGVWRDADGRLAFLLMYSSGARRNEILACRWKSLDLETRVFTIQEQLDERRQLTLPKWGHIRRVPLPQCVCDELADYRRKCFRHGDDDFVFADIQGKPHSIRWCRNMFIGMLEALGISEETRKERVLKIHSFRATGHSHLIAAGFDRASARISFGWTDEQTQERYTSLRPDDLRRQAELLEAVLRG